MPATYHPYPTDVFSGDRSSTCNVTETHDTRTTGKYFYYRVLL